MLADDRIQLLTAYVDGELSPRQREAVLRLLYESSEAREIVRQLQENRHKLKQLPRRKLELDFAQQVLHAIAVAPPAPVPLPALPVRRPVATRIRWAPYAIAGLAAAVLFTVTLAGALYVALGLPEDLFNPGDVLAKKGPEPEPMPLVAEAPKGEGRDDVTPARKGPNPLIGRVVEGVYQQYAVHIPPERGFSFALDDLPKEQVATQVAAELKKSEALHLDVLVRNNPEAMHRLKAVLKKHKIELVIDPGSTSAMQKAPAKTELLIYAENLKADEWATILKELAHHDKKAHPFQKVTVASLAPRERQQVTDLLGIDPTTRVDPKETAGIINPKVNPKAKNPPPKKDRVAVVLPQEPQAKASEEVRQFLLQPARPEPGSIRVLVRIRQE
jgi:hypothetical protein